MERLLIMVDMDGTLFDTFGVNYCAYKEALEREGFRMERKEFQQYFGRHYKDFLPLIVGDNQDLVEKIHEQKKQLYKKYIFKTRKNEMLLQILNHMKDSARIALVTTASRKNVDDMLAYFHMETYFDMVIVQEDVHQMKPDPECYAMVMDQYAASADQCMIFEDSDAGISAAKEVCSAVFKVEGF